MKKSMKRLLALTLALMLAVVAPLQRGSGGFGG